MNYKSPYQPMMPWEEMANQGALSQYLGMGALSAPPTSPAPLVSTQAPQPMHQYPMDMAPLMSPAPIMNTPPPSARSAPSDPSDFLPEGSWPNQVRGRGDIPHPSAPVEPPTQVRGRGDVPTKPDEPLQAGPQNGRGSVKPASAEPEAEDPTTPMEPVRPYKDGEIQIDAPGILAGVTAQPGPDGSTGFGISPEMAPQGNSEKKSFVDKLLGGWKSLSDDQKDLRLLAIGAGLLSGDDMASGMAAAAENLLGVKTGEVEDKREDALLAAAQGREDQQNAEARAWQEYMAGVSFNYDQQLIDQRAAATPAQYQRIGTVMLPDGSQVGGVSYDPSNAQYFTFDETGQRKDLPGAMPVNNSDASGTRFLTDATNVREQAQEARSTLRIIDDVLPALEDMKYGVPGFVQDLQANMKTLSGRLGLSEEELMRRVVQGEVQGLIGQARTEVVGPGVMTEQDALRVLSALGGDAQSLFSNPQVAMELLGKIRDRTQTRYNEASTQYEQYRKTPALGTNLIPLDPLDQPMGAGALSSPQPASDIEDLLQKYE